MDDDAIEALREVLQDITSTIELLSSRERSGAALIQFIEEMLKTIESWAAKYNVFFEDGSLIVNAAHNHPNTEAIDSQNSGQMSLDLADPSSRQRPNEGEAVQQSIDRPNQEPTTCNTDSGGDHLLHSQNDGVESDGRQTVPSQMDHSSGVTASSAGRKTRSEATSMHVNVTSTDDGEANMPSPQLEKGLKSDKAVLGNEYFGRKGDRIEAPSWLPEGWIIEGKIGGTSGNVGSKNKVYVDPTLQHHFQSKKEVLAFLGTTKRKRGRPRKSDSLKDISPGQANDTAQMGSVSKSAVGSKPEAQLPSNFSSINMSSHATVPAESIDTKKRGRGRPRKVDSSKNLPQTQNQHVEHSVLGQAGNIPESVISSNIEAQEPSSVLPTTMATQHLVAASSTMNSTSIPLPHASGQPSEWLVYESLASLPFPMFEHLRQMENNVNKLATTSSPPASLWPWMLGNTEGLKKPFTDIKLNDSKPVEETKQEEATATSFAGELQVGEAGPKRPKKVARKNAS